MFTIAKDPEFLIETNNLRFRAGKLVMLSPKHQPSLSKGGSMRHIPLISEVKLYDPPAEEPVVAGTQPAYLGTLQQPHIPWLGSSPKTAQSFVLGNPRHLGFGEPLLVLEDPWLVNLEAVHKACKVVWDSGRYGAAPHMTKPYPEFPAVNKINRNYALETLKSVWVFSALKGDNRVIVTCTPKAWLHYLATVVPLRVAKYGLK